MHYQAAALWEKRGGEHDLIREHPDLGLGMDRSVWDNLQAIYEQKNIQFVFVMDEWDAIFQKSFVTGEDKKSHLEL